MNSQSQELLPCPFCGSSDVGGASGIVSCYQCGIQTQKHETTAYAGTVWNTRAQLLLQREGGEAAPVAYMRTVKVAGSPDTPPEYDIEFQTEPYGDAEKWTPLYAQQPTAPGGEVVACRHTVNRRAEYDHIKCLDCGHVKTDLSQDWGISRDKWFASLEIAKFYQTHGYLPAAPSPAKEQG